MTEYISVQWGGGACALSRGMAMDADTGSSRLIFQVRARLRDMLPKR